MKEDNFIYIFLYPPRTGGSTIFRYIEKNLLPGQALDMDHENIFHLDPSRRDNVKYLSGHTTYYGVHRLFPGKKPRYLIAIRDPAEMRVSLYHSRMREFPRKNIQTFDKWYSLRKKNETTLFLDETYRSRDKTVVKLHRTKKMLRELLDKIDRTKTTHTVMKKLMKKQLSKKSMKKAFENAKSLLDECWFVFITKTIDDDLRILANLLGIKAKPNNRYERYGKIPENFYKLTKYNLTEKMRKKIYEDNPLDLKIYKYASELNRKGKQMALV